jgi:hypothetical protein
VLAWLEYDEEGEGGGEEASDERVETVEYGELSIGTVGP